MCNKDQDLRRRSCDASSVNNVQNNVLPTCRPDLFVCRPEGGALPRPSAGQSRVSCFPRRQDHISSLVPLSTQTDLTICLVRTLRSPCSGSGSGSSRYRLHDDECSDAVRSQGKWSCDLATRKMTCDRSDLSRASDIAQRISDCLMQKQIFEQSSAFVVVPHHKYTHLHHNTQ